MRRRDNNNNHIYKARWIFLFEVGLGFKTLFFFFFFSVFGSRQRTFADFVCLFSRYSVVGKGWVSSLSRYIPMRMIGQGRDRGA